MKRKLPYFGFHGAVLITNHGRTLFRFSLLLFMPTMSQIRKKVKNKSKKRLKKEIDTMPLNDFQRNIVSFIVLIIQFLLI